LALGSGNFNPVYKIDVRGSSEFDGVSVDGSCNFRLVTAPIAPTLTLSAGGNVNDGLHWYFVTYTTAIGETNSGARTSITTGSGNNTVTLTIPVSTDPRVTGRKIYRTKAGQTSDDQYFLVSIPNNTATSYVDTLPDTSLGANRLQSYRANTTSKYLTINGTRTVMFDANLTALGIGAGATLVGSGEYAPIRTVLIGTNAGSALTTGVSNILIGTAGAKLTSNNQNVMIGDFAGANVVSGGAINLIGSQAGTFLTSAARTICIGQDSGNGLLSGGILTVATNSIFLGTSSKALVDNTDNEIVIGYNAIGAGANSVVLGNNSITKTILKGNVGLGGISTPQTPLHVGDGNVPNAVFDQFSSNFVTVSRQANNTALSVITASNTANQRPIYLFQRSRGTLPSPAPVQNNDNLGDLLFGGYSTSGFAYGGGIFSFVDGTVGVGTVPTRISIVTGSGVATRLERLTVKSDGNVGIGTVTPSNKFDITSAVGNNSHIHFGQNANEGGYLTSILASQFTISGGSEYVNGSWIARDTNSSQINNFNGAIYFRADTGLTIGNTFTPTERMTITTTGNVGIGTITPAVKTVIQQADQAYELPGVTSIWDIALGIAANTPLISGMDFKNFSTTGQVRLMARNNQNDYIAMNTFGSAGTTTLFGYSVADVASIFLQAGTDTDKKLVIGTLTAGQTVIGSNSLPRIIVEPTTPTAIKLISNSTTAGSTLDLGFLMTTSQDLTATLGIRGIRGATVGGSDFAIFTNSLNRINVLGSNGYTGFGIEIPTEVVDVNGNIKATGARINGDVNFYSNNSRFGFKDGGGEYAGLFVLSKDETSSYMGDCLLSINPEEGFNVSAGSARLEIANNIATLRRSSFVIESVETGSSSFRFENIMGEYASFGVTSIDENSSFFGNCNMFLNPEDGYVVSVGNNYIAINTTTRIGSGSNYTEIEADGTINAPSYKTGTETGITTTKTIVTDVRMDTSSGQLQKKFIDLTFTNGLLTAQGKESDWTNTTDI